MKFAQKVLLFTLFTLVPTYHIHPMFSAPTVKNAKKTREVSCKAVLERNHATKKLENKEEAPTKILFDYDKNLNQIKDVKEFTTNRLFFKEQKAKDLKTAGHNINRLSLVCREFNESNNRPETFLATKDFLLESFPKASDADVCKALHTPPAKKYLTIQSQLRLFLPKAIITAKDPLDEETVTKKFEIFKKNGADFNFTFSSYGQTKVTYLMSAISMNDPRLTGKLIEWGANPENPHNGQTPLQYAHFVNASPEVSKVIEDAIAQKKLDQELASTESFK